MIRLGFLDQICSDFTKEREGYVCVGEKQCQFGKPSRLMSAGGPRNEESHLQGNEIQLEFRAKVVNLELLPVAG